MTNFQLSVLFFLQLTAILAACRAVGWLAQRFGQPQVVGEMITGVILGPSVFGLLAPSIHAELFPKQSMTIIFAVSQVGLALYMFLVGVEFRSDLISSRKRSAVSVSLAGILVPFALGSLIAFFLRTAEGMFSPTVALAEKVLFLGAAMSITAFPMLARIIYERGLSSTRVGTLALAAGSIDDAAAWCVLAIVLASFSGDPTIAVIAIGGGVLYAFFVLLLLRPALRPLARRLESPASSPAAAQFPQSASTANAALSADLPITAGRPGAGSGGPAVRGGGEGGNMSLSMLGFVLMLVMLGSWYTDYIGIYAVFGAFLMGAAMPRGRFAAELHRLIYPLTTTLLLPLFFVYSGLNTRIGLVDTTSEWLIALVILAAATLGKGVACYAAARINGEGHPESMAIGALMNARGLMELIILNIGLERGIITETLFSIMVIMAVVTTLMATPIFELVYGPIRDRLAAEQRVRAATSHA